MVGETTTPHFTGRECCSVFSRLRHLTASSIKSTGQVRPAIVSIVCSFQPAYHDLNYIVISSWGGDFASRPNPTIGLTLVSPNERESGSTRQQPLEFEVD
jgi:hypothetical protein